MGSIDLQHSSQLEYLEEVIRTALTEAIIPLNGVRRTFALSPEELVGALQRTIERTDDVEWKETYLASQQELSRALLPFFEPDSFFARVSLAFELLSQRPIAFKQAKIVHDLRPVFNEDNSDLLGLLQTNTLVLRFWDTRNERTLHISLDSGDLESLAKEIDIALKRIEVSKRVAEERKLQLLNDGD